MEKITLASENYTLGLTDPDDIALYNLNKETPLGRDVLGVFGGGAVTEYEVSVLPEPYNGYHSNFGNQTEERYEASDIVMYFVKRSNNLYIGMREGKLYAFSYKKARDSSEPARVAGEVEEYSLFLKVLETKKPWTGKRVSARLHVTFEEYKRIKEQGQFHLKSYVKIGSISYDGLSADYLMPTLKAGQELLSELYEVERHFSYSGSTELRYALKEAGLPIQITSLEERVI